MIASLHQKTVWCFSQYNAIILLLSLAPHETKSPENSGEVKSRMKSLIRKKYYALIVGVVFVFYLWIASQIPYTHDDWDWGLDIGLQHLLTADINSRYVGNLIEVLLTRSVFLKNLVMGLVFTALPLAMAHFTMVYLKKLDNSAEIQPLETVLFLAANALILLMPISVWRQTYGWVAGFSNYVVSGLFLILYYIFIAKHEVDCSGRSVAAGMGVFFFGLIMQLFLENLSFYFFIFSLFLFVRRIIKKKKVCMMLLLLLAGNLIGLLIVFSSDVYQTLWKTGSAIDGYRRLMYNQNASLFFIAQELFIRVYYILLPEMLDNSAHIQVIILCALIFENSRQVLRAKDGKAVFIVWDAIHVLFFAFYLYRSVMIHNFPDQVNSSYQNTHFLYLVCIMGNLVIVKKTQPERFPWLLAIWIAPVLIIAPMAAVNTVGSRTYFTSNCCYILFALMLFALLWEYLNNSLRIVSAGTVVLCVLSCGAHYISVYREIGNSNRERLAIIEDAKNGKIDTCHFAAFPNEEYLWYPSPETEERIQ